MYLLTAPIVLSSLIILIFFNLEIRIIRSKWKRNQYNYNSNHLSCGTVYKLCVVCYASDWLAVCSAGNKSDNGRRQMLLLRCAFAAVNPVCESDVLTWWNKEPFITSWQKLQEKQGSGVFKGSWLEVRLPPLDPRHLFLFKVTKSIAGCSISSL